MTTPSASSRYIIEDQNTQGTLGSHKRVKTSSVWSEFTEKVQPDGTRKAYCLHCGASYSLSKKSGTSHLKRHIESCLKRQVDETMTSEGLESARKSNYKFKFDPVVTRREIACMLIEDEEPFSKVESRRFRRVLASLNPEFQMVSRNTIRNDCELIYKEMKVELMNLFSKTCSRVALTTYLWTSNQTLSYMAITAHFIDDEWKLQKRVIQFFKVETPHTGTALAHSLLKSLVEWDIDKKISSITLDNASANDSMCAIVRTSLADRSALLVNGTIFHMRCCAHILHLIVQNGLDRIHDSVNHIRESIKYVEVTPSRKQKFEEVVEQVRLTSKKGLCLDIANRWNSTYLMLESALIYKKAFIALETWDLNFNPPSAQDWGQAERFFKFLKIFYNATNLFSGSKYPTINTCLSEILAIHSLLKKESQSLDSVMAEMAQRMQKKFNKYWGEKTKVISTSDSRLLIALGAILDPRQKVMFVEYAFKEFYGDETEYVDEVKNVLRLIYEEYQSKHGDESSVPYNQNAETSRSEENLEDGSPNVLRMFHQLI